VRVDQQQGVVGGGVGGGDGDAVGAGGLQGAVGLALFEHGDVGLVVKLGQLAELYPLDVAADAALAEGQRHPRFEMGDHLWGHMGVDRQVIVQPVRPGLHQAPQPPWAVLVAALQVLRIDIETRA
jgi:hypothetical protein